MPYPQSGACAYRAYCQALGLPCDYDALTPRERLAWGAAAQAAVHDALETPAQVARLHALRALPEEGRTRRQHREVLQAAASPGDKICAHCFSAWPREAYWRNPQSKDGRDSYCRACRQTLDAQRPGRRGHRRRAA